MEKRRKEERNKLINAFIFFFFIKYRELIRMAKGYCVKCKKKGVEMSGAEEVTMKNGRRAMKGKCPKCGTGMYCILGGKA